MEIKIKNFKSIQDISLEIKNLTILTGLNSSGKSSVIDSIRMLDKASKGELAYLNNQGGFKDLLCEWFVGKEEIKIIYKDPVKKCSLTLSSTGTPKFEGKFSYKVYYVGADRIGAQLYTQSFSKITDQTNFTDPNVCLSYFQQNRSQPVQKGLLPSGEDDKALMYAVEDWMEFISPNTKANVLDFPEIDIRSLRINNRRVSNVGFGISYIFPVLLGLLALSGQKDTILILENPEAHIHPKAQTIIGELIAKVANTGTKIILETHSDHILSGIRIATKEKVIPSDDIILYFLKLGIFDKEKYLSIKEQIHIDTNGRLSNWPTDFFDQFDINLERLLK